jgi:uncharacterized protein (DUF983 family)
VDHCDSCGEEFFHHQADDYPAYVVVALVGHALFPIILIMDEKYAPPMWVDLAICVPLALISVLALLQPVKGAVVGLQWQLGMFGFELTRSRQLSDPTSGT